MAELAQGLRAYVIIGLIAAAAALAGVFTMPPLDRDESRYAQATAQMLETGDLINISFQDEARNKKPAGIYWMQAAVVGALSDSEARQIWAYRLPSVLGAILAALACFWGGSRLIGREAAFAGAALFAATALLGIEGGIAKTDAMLAGATTLAMAALANLRHGDGGRKTVMLFWFAIGLGLLIKGPVTPMVAGLTLVALGIWERRLNWMNPLLFIPGPLLAIAMFVPWFLAIQHATGGDFLRESLGQDMLGKVSEGQERHGGLPGYYIAFIPLLLFPATLFLVPGIARIWDTLRLKVDDHATEAARFLVAWVVPTWIVFELTSTKLPHYVLPVYPALALIAGRGLMELADSRPWQRWTSTGLFGLGAFLSVILLPGIALLYANGASWDAVRLSMTGFEGGFVIEPDQTAILIILTGAALFALVAGANLTGTRKSILVALSLAVAAGLGWHVMARSMALPNAYAVRLAEQVRAAREYSDIITGIPASEIVTASSYTEPSLVFSLGTDTQLGTAEEVLAFAESRDEPMMVVLDLSREPGLIPLIIDRPTDRVLPEWLVRRGADATDQADITDIDPGAAYAGWSSVRQALEVCDSRPLASGTNYSRGDDTVLAIFFTRCPQTDEPLRMYLRFNETNNEDTPDDPQD